MLPCRLPARLLNEGCLLLLAVDGREESFVPCLNLDLGAPADADRLASRSNELDERPVSGVGALPLTLLLLLCLLFLLLTLLVGNGGNAQSWLSSSGEGGRLIAGNGVDDLRGGCKNGDLLPAPGLTGDCPIEP